MYESYIVEVYRVVMMILITPCSESYDFWKMNTVGKLCRRSCSWILTVSLCDARAAQLLYLNTHIYSLTGHWVRPTIFYSCRVPDWTNKILPEDPTGKNRYEVTPTHQVDRVLAAIAHELIQEH